MSAQVPPEDTLDGLWAFNGQYRKLDDDLARTKMKGWGTGQDNQKHEGTDAFHGTYTRPYYHYFVLRSGLPKPSLIQGPPQQAWGWKNPDPQPAPTPINNFILEIFDEEGNFAHAEWNSSLQWGKGDDEIGAWAFRYDPITLKVPAGNRHLPKGDTLVLTPSLTLTPGTSREKDDRFPRNGADETTPCPLPFISDGSASPPSQYIRYDNGALLWVRPDLNLSLQFKKQSAPTPDPKKAAWRDTFVVPIIQWSLPFVGWNPQQLDLSWNPVGGQAADQPPVKSIVNAGTGDSTTQTPDGQQLLGNPIFAVPDNESRKYEGYSIGEKDSAFLPWGAAIDYEPHKNESTHSQMLSSTHELVNSWAMNLGFSAGIEKLASASVKGSYHDKVTSQQENESRYSLTRRVTTQYKLYLVIPNLQLDQQFSDTILYNLKMLNNGDPPEWASFVTTYGTHYAHGLTYGQMDFAEMRFSLEAEVKSHEQGFKLEEKASAMLDAIKFGESAGVGHDWSTTDGSKVSGEDVTSDQLGFDGKPVAIFLDLRPIWELFSPVFFPPNITEDAGPEYVVAPFVWTKLRSDFKNYVTKTCGVNQPLDKAYDIDFMPRFIKVRAAEFRVWTPNKSPCIYGYVRLSAAGGAQFVKSGSWEVGRDEARKFANGDNLSGIEQIYATFAVTPKVLASGGGYQLAAQLTDYDTQESQYPVASPLFRIGDWVSEPINPDGGGWGLRLSFKLENDPPHVASSRGKT